MILVDKMESFSPCVFIPVVTMLSHTLLRFTGMDASAQTGSHEMTIPNDVSVSSRFLVTVVCFITGHPIFMHLCLIGLDVNLSHFSFSSAVWGI